MAMGPRKKVDFFNRGRGYDIESEADDPPEVFPGHEPLLEAPGYDPDPNPSYREGEIPYPGPSYSGDLSSYDPQRHASYEVSQPGHYGAPQYPGPSGYSLPTPEDGAYGGACAPLDSHGGGRPWRGGEEEGERRRGKRSQTCRLCANHGRTVEMKGHKLYCPFQKPHDCAKCEITIQRRIFTAAQQRLTRSQQLQLQDGQEPTQALPGPAVNPREFPRLPELLQDCNNIIDETLFARINEVVRSRSNQPQ